MKNRILAVFAGILSLFTTHSFAQSYPFTINGKLQNISPMPQKMYLSSAINGLLKQDKDSVSVVDGEYHFTGELNVDEAVTVTISDSAKANFKNIIVIFLDKGEFNVISNNVIKNFTFSGSASAAQQQADAIKSGIEKEKQELKTIAGSEAYKTSDAMQADVLKRSKALGFKGLVDTYSFLKNNPDSRINPFMTYVLVSSGFISQKSQDTLVNNLPARVKADRLGQYIAHIPVMRDSLNKVAVAKSLSEQGKIPLGTKAPDFTENDTRGNAVSLASFKGKYVLVDFWASWCVPCRNENPNVVKAYNTYKNKGFTVLGVSLDAASSKAAWLKAIASDGLSWTEVSDLSGWKNGAASLYGVSSIPQNFLIDPNGVVIGKNLRGEDLQQKLATIFK